MTGRGDRALAARVGRQFWIWLTKAAATIFAAYLGWSQVVLPQLSASFAGYIDRLHPPPVVQFVGNGIVLLKGPFQPGETVPILYQTMRNTDDCDGEIIVQFFDARHESIARQYTTRIRVDKAEVTASPAPFVVPLRLPRNMEAGRYLYMPKYENTTESEFCRSLPGPRIPPSGPFDVAVLPDG